MSACLRACASACACACGRACARACGLRARGSQHPWSTLGVPPRVPRSTPGVTLTVPSEYPREYPREYPGECPRSAAACSRRCTACGYPTTRRRRRTRGSEYSEYSEYSLRTHRIDDGPTRLDRHWAAGTKSAVVHSCGGGAPPVAGMDGVLLFVQPEAEHFQPPAGPLGSFVRADGPVDAHGHRRSAMVPSDRTGAPEGGRRRGASDKQHGQSGRHGKCTARTGLVDRGRS